MPYVHISTLYDASPILLLVILSLLKGFDISRLNIVCICNSLKKYGHFLTLSINTINQM